MSDSLGDGRPKIDLGIDGIVDATPVASGSTATVYRATQASFARTVAVKVFRPGLEVEQIAKLDREQQLMGKLSGQTATVPVFAGGLTKSGLRYVVMPYFRRGSLREAMAERGPMPWREATFLVLPVAIATADLHALGVLHRDIKPGNIMLTEHLHPRLTDFGISLDLNVVDSNVVDSNVVDSNVVADAATVAFTPSFGAPETFDHVVRSPSVDVYSLGATLWALLAGRSPFVGMANETAPVGANSVSEILARARAGTPGPAHATTPAAIEAVIQRAMSRNPADRQRDGRAFAAELRRAIREADQSDEDEPRHVSAAVETAERASKDWALALFVAMALVGSVVLALSLLR